LNSRKHLYSLEKSAFI